MNANATTLAEVLSAPNQYVIPIFQRYYSWKKNDWQTLFEDALDLHDPEQPGDYHFLGSLVLHAQEPTSLGEQYYQVVDGQQRLITISLLLSSLRDVAKARNNKGLARRITEEALLRTNHQGVNKYRVYPRQRDRDRFISVIENSERPEGPMGEALDYFKQRLQTEDELQSDEALERFFNLLWRRLTFVYILLGRDENAYQIFSSLNSTGVELTQADLIRNFVFMHLPFEEQEGFEDRSWKPLEGHFENSSRELDGAALSGFFRNFLLIGGRYIRPDGTFQEFERRYSAGNNFRPYDLAIELSWFASYYDIIRGLIPHRSDKIEVSLAKLRGLQTFTTVPAQMKILHAFEEGQFDEEQASNSLELLSSFILRRLVCGESSRPYSRWFVTACAEMDKDPKEGLRSFLVSKTFPENERFRRDFVGFNLYGSEYCRHILEMFERWQGHRESADLSKAQIEHIMPQTLGNEWKEDLGKSWERVYAEWLHTPGNLTISAYNAELYNHAFAIKRREYAKSNVCITRELADREQWTENEMRQRGERLADLATEIWGS